MVELVQANVIANLAFYRRSRLLLVFLLITGLQSLPPLFAHSGVQTFNALQEIFSDLNGFLLLLAAGLGLFIILSHLRNRSLKMVFTKPCTPAVWLGSALLSAVAVSLLLSGIVLGCTLVLSLLWHVPVRAGLVFVSVDTFVASLGLIAYLMLLATLLHPAVAATVALIFNADMFYSVQLWTLATIRSGNSSKALRVLEGIFHYLYLVLPMVHPYGKETRDVYASLPGGTGSGITFCTAWAMGSYLSVFCYLSALLALQRQKHI